MHRNSASANCEVIRVGACLRCACIILFRIVKINEKLLKIQVF